MAAIANSTRPEQVAGKASGALAFYGLIWRSLGLLLPVWLHWRAHRGKEDRQRLGERYGKTALPRPAGTVVWLHAASIGESVSALVLANALLAARPGLQLLLTSGTVTSAMMISRAITAHPAADQLRHQFQPLDHPAWIARFLEHWKPQLAVMLESDFWPGIISGCRQHGIPVGLASAQVSPRSMARWQGLGRHLGNQLFPQLATVLAADETNADRFRLLAESTATVAAASIPIAAMGSLKAAAPPLPVNAGYCDGLRQAAAGLPVAARQPAKAHFKQQDQLENPYSGSRLVLLLASSHQGEEAYLLDSLQLIESLPPVLVIIAPRHPHRGAALAEAISKRGMVTTRRSTSGLPDSTTECWLADSLGEMGSLLVASDIVIMGGGFMPHGGHNPMEAAAHGRGVISGHHVDKNRAAFGQLQAAGGVILTTSRQQLAEAITSQLDPAARARLGHAAASCYTGAKDAAEDTARQLLCLLEDSRHQQAGQAAMDHSTTQPTEDYAAGGRPAP